MEQKRSQPEKKHGPEDVLKAEKPQEQSTDDEARRRNSSPCINEDAEEAGKGARQECL